jgi:hydrogenase nickel incorporation protein HypB
VLRAPAERKRIRLEHDVLQHNDRLASENRELFRRRNVLALNLMSSPGSGKTTLLERTIRESGLRERVFVVQGDQATDRDAARIERAGARAHQINTGQGCHLDASMVARGFAALNPPPAALLAIENVGNLVCPALFDLGEAARVTVISTTEGADKPLKYPHMFRRSDLVLINKVDLLEHVDFDLTECSEHVRAVNPDATVLPVSARRGDGLSAWYDWLRRALHRQNVEAQLRSHP